MPDEVLTIKEAAALLKLAEKAVYTMAQAGEIPGQVAQRGAISASAGTGPTDRIISLFIGKPYRALSFVRYTQGTRCQARYVLRQAGWSD